MYAIKASAQTSTREKIIVEKNAIKCHERGAQIG